ncbi:MAG: hypothetical protein IT430_05510 [Phycisphaerales bacterium]|nr:hypothetical protein [Phycisphaerales bacterium]
MNHDITDIDASALAIVLDSTGPVTLAPEQAALMRSLLEQFAADQVTLLTLERRLARHEQAGERLDRALTSGLNLLASRLDRPAIGSDFDLAESRRIRAELAEQVAQMQQPQEIWAAAARTALALVRLL